MDAAIVKSTPGGSLSIKLDYTAIIELKEFLEEAQQIYDHNITTGALNTDRANAILIGETLREVYKNHLVKMSLPAAENKLKLKRSHATVIWLLFNRMDAILEKSYESLYAIMDGIHQKLT